MTGTPSAGASAFCGDWLLTFTRRGDGWPTRHPGGDWQPLHRAGDGTLWTQPPGEGWRGAPWASHEEGDWKLWLLGETYPLAGPPADLWHGIPDARTRPTQLNGHCLLLAWNRRNGEWHLWTDRFGTLHAYRAAGASDTAVGTCFRAVAGASRRQLDWLGLTGFCALGFFPQDRTHFEDVRILRPASHYVFAADGAAVRGDRYWQWRFEPDLQRSYEETVDELARRLDSVMADLTRGRQVALPISGGLDSRSTVAALGVDRPEVQAYSYGYSANSKEVDIARRIAARRSLPFHGFEIRPYLFARLDRVQESLEGFQDVTLSRQQAVTDELAEWADFVIAAHWGDVWLDDMGLSHHAGEDEALLCHVMGRIGKPGGWLIDHLCRRHLGREDPHQLVRSMVLQELAGFEEIEDADFRVKAFKTDQWSFRATTAALRSYQPGAFPRLPFYDTRLTDFFATVPSARMRGRKLQIDYLKRHAPDLARVTWDAYETNLYRVPYFNSLLLPKRAAKRLWRTLTRRQAVERNWEVQLREEAGRQGLQHWLLRPGLKLHELVPPTDLSQLLETFSAPRPSPALGYTVSMILTLSVWLEAHG